MWFGIWILSLVLSVILLPIGFVFGFIKSIYQNKFFKEGLPNLNQKFKRLSTAIDIFGNVVCAELFNSTLISKNSNHMFGNYGETISEVIGWNKKFNTLSKCGIHLDNILNFFDKNHSLNSIKNKIHN